MQKLNFTVPLINRRRRGQPKTDVEKVFLSGLNGAATGGCCLADRQLPNNKTNIIKILGHWTNNTDKHAVIDKAVAYAHKVNRILLIQTLFPRLNYFN